MTRLLYAILIQSGQSPNGPQAAARRLVLSPAVPYFPRDRWADQLLIIAVIIRGGATALPTKFIVRLRDPQNDR